MEDAKLTEYIDQQRWLLNNGLVPDSVKNQLFFYGSVVHPRVQAVEVQIHAENKLVDYVIYVDAGLMKLIEKYNRLSTATSLFGMWRFSRFLKKEGTLDFQAMLSKFVSDFCGPKWIAKVKIINFDTYVDTIEVESESEGSSPQSNKLPD